MPFHTDGSNNSMNLAGPHPRHRDDVSAHSQSMLKQKLNDSVYDVGRVHLVSSSSSSSIGEPSSSSEFGSALGLAENSNDQEVESARRGPLNLSPLEDALPIKRGLSQYFNGHSQSFCCLADAITAPTLAKDAHPKKRNKGLSMYENRHRSFPALSRMSTSNISKKNSFGSSRQLAIAMAMDSTYAEGDEDNDIESVELHPPLPRMRGFEQKDNVAPSQGYSMKDMHGATPPKKMISFADSHNLPSK